MAEVELSGFRKQCLKDESVTDKRSEGRVTLLSRGVTLSAGLYCRFSSRDARVELNRIFPNPKP